MSAVLPAPLSPTSSTECGSAPGEPRLEVAQRAARRSRRASPRGPRPPRAAAPTPGRCRAGRASGHAPPHRGAHLLDHARRQVLGQHLDRALDELAVRLAARPAGRRSARPLPARGARSRTGTERGLHVCRKSSSSGATDISTGTIRLPRAGDQQLDRAQARPPPAVTGHSEHPRDRSVSSPVGGRLDRHQRDDGALLEREGLERSPSSSRWATGARRARSRAVPTAARETSPRRRRHAAGA